MVPTDLQIVIVSDESDDAEMVAQALHDEGFEFSWQRVATADELRASLERRPHLVLSDWHLTQLPGREALDIVRGHDRQLPFIIVSGPIGEESTVQAMRHGADDYVGMDALAGLGPAVLRALDAPRRALDAPPLLLGQAGSTEELRFLAAVLANVRDSVIVTDLDGRITYWNDGAQVTYGWTAAEMAGRTIDAITVDVVASTDTVAAAALVAGEPYKGVWMMRHKDGRKVQVDTHTSVMLGSDGHPIGLVCVSRDVSEQRRMEMEHQRLAAAIEQVADAVVIADSQSRITYVNRAFERVTGYGRDEVTGLNPRILQAGHHPPSFYTSMWRQLSVGGVWEGDMVNRRKDGSTFHERASITRVTGVDGSISYVAVKQDVTRARELEATAERIIRERALISKTMAGLPAGQSLRAAALEVSRNIVQLSGLQAVSTLIFDADHRAIPLAIVSADGVEHYHPTLAVELSRYLRQRASGGPWIESWVGSPGQPVTWLAEALEVSQVARLPVRAGGLLVGLIAAFAAGHDAASRLADLLPALGEFADLSGIILGSHLDELAAASPGRERIDAIISGAAFRPVFQPVVDLETLEMVGFEALTRFDSGESPAATFAEAWLVGLGPGLEMATLRAAIQASADLPAGRWLSVNVSPQLIVREHALAETMATLDRPLVIEITEHQSVPDPVALRAAIRSLGANVRLAVDDAGAGVANFGHIVGLRPDFVKLDIGLVKGINRDVGRQALMVGMRHFARSAGCRLIAEGIESAAEADTVAALGCEFGQGHLFGAAEPAGHWVTGVVALLRGDAASGPVRPTETKRGDEADEDG